LNIIEKARKIIPGVVFSTDIISGFPTETYEDHLATMDVIRKVRFDGAYMFKYSPREGTKAYQMKDDIDEAIKSKRLTEIINEQQNISYEINQELIGKEFTVLVEGFSKKSDQYFAARTDTNKVVIFPVQKNIVRGDYVSVKITKGTSGTLFGDFICKTDLVEEDITKIA
jgi:tRNA-2-methylthio-N6-dimethylallyladenosine synthase